MCIYIYIYIYVIHNDIYIYIYILEYSLLILVISKAYPRWARTPATPRTPAAISPASWSASSTAGNSEQLRIFLKSCADFWKVTQISEKLRRFPNRVGSTRAWNKCWRKESRICNEDIFRQAATFAQHFEWSCQITGTGTWKHLKSTFKHMFLRVSLQSNICITFLG